jgi:dihydroxy-acid dehydratase
MSGTSYGTCVLHVCPEAQVGGPLSLLQTGDVVSLSVKERRLDMRVSEAELARRRSHLTLRAPRFPRGYGRLFVEHVTQADAGCDFDFLEGNRPIDEPEIH